MSEKQYKNKFDFEQYNNFPALKNLLRMLTDRDALRLRRHVLRVVHLYDHHIKKIMESNLDLFVKAKILPLVKNDFIEHSKFMLDKSINPNRKNFLKEDEHTHLVNFFVGKCREAHKLVQKERYKMGKYDRPYKGYKDIIK